MIVLEREKHVSAKLQLTDLQVAIYSHYGWGKGPMGPSYNQINAQESLAFVILYRVRYLLMTCQ